MKSLLFCTSYMGAEGPALANRWTKWLDYYATRLELFGATQLCLIDDASPRQSLTLPLSVIAADRTLPKTLPDMPVLFRFNRHLGRQDVFRFPGWWRSFTFAAKIAEAYGFEKVIHLESDAFVVSHSMAAYIHSLEKGWTSFWCPRYRRPESAIQVICRDSLPQLKALYATGPALWGSNICAETTLPFTEVCMTFTGDRYGEYVQQFPPGADYVAQTPLATDLSRYLITTGQEKRKHVC